jgi:hypothetical protein
MPASDSGVVSLFCRYGSYPRVLSLNVFGVAMIITLLKKAFVSSIKSMKQKVYLAIIDMT